MASDLAVAVLAGAFALAGGLGGVLLSNSLSRRADETRLKAEDDRRWLIDRRTVYARFLGLSETMLRQIDGIAVFLSYDGTEPMSDEDHGIVTDDLFDYVARWEEELQPALGEVQLLATPHVADLADRMSGALMEVTPVVEKHGSFSEYYPTWFQARDLLQVLRDAMRMELGLSEMEAADLSRSADWPWMPDRPTRESYIQQHALARHKEHSQHHPTSGSTQPGKA